MAVLAFLKMFEVLAMLLVPFVRALRAHKKKKDGKVKVMNQQEKVCVVLGEQCEKKKWRLRLRLRL